MNDDELRAAIGRFIWFHSYELRPGIASVGAKRPEILAAEASGVFDPLELAGRSVLDVGAWNGFFSFEAKRRGAGRVLATDSFTWRHPEYRGQETVQLARAALGLEIETHEIDPTEIDASLGLFDVVLFLGVFYHLIDPIEVLRRLRLVTREALVVETHQDGLEIDRPAMIFYPGAELDHDPTNWWGPNPEAMYGLLRQAGFARVFYQDHLFCAPGGEWPLRRRGIYHAFVAQEPGALVAGRPGWLDLGEEANRRALRL